MSRVSVAKQAARTARAAAILACHSCGPTGWRLATDGTPVDPAVRCGHGTTPPPVGRDITEPIHEPPSEAAR
ncbi:hypothetical protein [Mycobacterium sp. AT1]|uniref:hypothetical protein n=1 Tax=Mycobacterium sp. AT1 TaxID=1961706 RepID=UPI0011528325|nr:hypothetical protein [Mycobacterium sp. AT1]